MKKDKVEELKLVIEVKDLILVAIAKDIYKKEQELKRLKDDYNIQFHTKLKLEEQLLEELSKRLLEEVKK
jgi:hypothetical protein